MCFGNANLVVEVRWCLYLVGGVLWRWGNVEKVVYVKVGDGGIEGFVSMEVVVWLNERFLMVIYIGGMVGEGVRRDWGGGGSIWGITQML